MFKIFIIMLFSITVFAGNQNLLKEINKRITKNNHANRVSFIILNLDNVLLNSSARYELLFNDYLKKHHSRVIKKYFKEKDFTNLKLNDILNDISALKLTAKQKENFIKYLKENYNSDKALSADMAIGESIDFVNNLYKNGAFIVYISKRSLNNIAPTIKKLKSLNFPIGKNKTSLIMEVNENNTRNIVSKWINMGEIIAVFSNNFKAIKLLTPYFDKNELFLISDDNPDSKEFTIIKSL